MKRIIKYGLVFAIIIIFVVIAYPVLFNRYGDNLIIIRQLVNLLILIDLYKYVNDSISKYSFGIYRYYKLLGMKEIDIVITYIKNNYHRYLVYYLLFLASVYAGNILSALLCTVQFVIYCNCFVLAQYVLMHKQDYKKRVICILSIASAVIVGNITYQVFNLIYKNVVFTEILEFMKNSTFISLYKEIFFECNMTFCALIMMFTMVLAKVISSLDDCSVIEYNLTKVKKISDNYINKSVGRRWFGLLRDIRIAFRNKENIFSYILVFMLYVFGCYFLGSNQAILFWMSFFCIMLINYGLESIYLNDTTAFKIYKLFGEKFDGFLQTKLRISFIINTVFGGVYVIRCFGNKCAEECLALLLIHIINVLYWNMYYSSIYIGMKRYGTFLDDIKKIIVLVIGIIPLINILFAIKYYKNGKRRWNYYVNNGQSDKKI